MDRRAGPWRSQESSRIGSVQPRALMSCRREDLGDGDFHTGRRSGSSWCAGRASRLAGVNMFRPPPTRLHGDPADLGSRVTGIRGHRVLVWSRAGSAPLTTMPPLVRRGLPTRPRCQSRCGCRRTVRHRPPASSPVPSPPRLSADQVSGGGLAHDQTPVVTRACDAKRSRQSGSWAALRVYLSLLLLVEAVGGGNARLTPERSQCEPCRAGGRLAAIRRSTGVPPVLGVAV